MNQIENRPIDSIKPYFKNAKLHTEKQIRKIADSIKEFSFAQPIVIDKEGVIIVGHGRYLAAKSMQLEEVPTLTLDLSEEKVRAYRLADNKLNESKWDIDLAIEELKTLTLEMVDLTGFDSNLLLETKEDEMPDLSKVGEPKSKEGDLYELGTHKLICGDSTKAETYKRLLEGDIKPRLVFTDPPYSVDYVSSAGMTCASEKYGGTGGRIFNDDKTPSEALEFYKQVLEQIYAFSSDDMTIYWWHAMLKVEINMQALREQGFHMSQIILWLKNSMIYSPGHNFHRIYEPCIVGWKEGKEHYLNRTFSSYTELWDLDIKTFAEHLDIWYQKRDNKNKYIHPTQKPVQLAERALKRSSEKGDIVLDAFGGSGSTMIACEQLERRARLIEIDPKFCDAIINRWVKYKNDFTIRKNGAIIQW